MADHDALAALPLTPEEEARILGALVDAIRSARNKHSIATDAEIARELPGAFKRAGLTLTTLDAERGVRVTGDTGLQEIRDKIVDHVGQDYPLLDLLVQLEQALDANLRVTGDAELLAELEAMTPPYRNFGDHWENGWYVARNTIIRHLRAALTGDTTEAQGLNRRTDCPNGCGHAWWTVGDDSYNCTNN